MKYGTWPQSSTTLLNTFLKIKLADSWPADVGDGAESTPEIMKPKKGSPWTIRHGRG